MTKYFQGFQIDQVEQPTDFGTCFKGGFKFQQVELL
jgi:hypothetical protein